MPGRGLFAQNPKMPARSNSTVILSVTSKSGIAIIYSHDSSINGNTTTFWILSARRNKDKPKKTEKLPSENTYVPNIPEPSHRAEFMNYWMNLSLDDKTANKMLWISDSGCKVSRRTEEVCPVLDRPERYEYSPQVVCQERIWNTRAYWEVEYSGWVVIGVTYEGAGRRANSGPSGLGENEESWGLCWSGSAYQFWFNGVNKDISDVPYSSTIGVYVDQPAGIISFYAVTGEGAEREIQLLHNVRTTITKKILPGFWIGVQSSCRILRKSE